MSEFTREFDLVPPWPFSRDEFPIGEDAGNNKFGWTECPTCQKKPEEVPLTTGKTVCVFPFRNELSAREYRISGMCQECQDGIFGKD